MTSERAFIAITLSKCYRKPMENKGKFVIRDTGDDHALATFLNGRDIGQVALMALLAAVLLFAFGVAIGSAIGSL